jgi:putative membrane protein
MRQKLLAVIHWLIEENLIVATAVTSLAVSTLLIFHLPMAYGELLSLWIGTILSYSYAKERRLRYDRSWWWLLTLTACVSFLFLSWRGRIVLFLSIGLSIAYNTPFLRLPLRNIPYLKISIVAFCWVLGSVYLPLSAYEVPLFTYPVTTLALQYFLWVGVLILPFDIRDKGIDAAYLQTFPVAFGIVKTKVIGVLLMVIFVLLAFLGYPTPLIYVQLIVACITVLLLLAAQEHQSPLYSSLFVESIPMLYLIMVYTL